jgi:hypothetical protein
VVVRFTSRVPTRNILELFVKQRIGALVFEMEQHSPSLALDFLVDIHKVHLVNVGVHQHVLATSAQMV